MSKMSGGVYCIESYSEGETVRALLDYVEHLDHSVIHRRIDTPSELRQYIGRWSETPQYRVGYITGHGVPGAICVGAEDVSLRSAVRQGGFSNAGLDNGGPLVNLKGKALHVSVCAGLAVEQSELDALRADTGADLISGYSAEGVDWLHAGALDLVLLGTLANAGARKSFRRAITDLRDRDRYAPLFEKLEFKSSPSWQS